MSKPLDDISIPYEDFYEELSEAVYGTDFELFNDQSGHQQQGLSAEDVQKLVGDQRNMPDFPLQEHS
jgi:hypothetical protein